ncbi:arsenic resistance protein [Kocuria varians]|uniref:Arsenic resistance protein n=1 Tax=Kocuria varians TaxID=1272 RepID=A0A7D7KZT6_KOCVA|nr:bile acid:sodium symporter [Kocuria varians]QMS57265.1 hypothetical protein CIB50_0001998 [Kocuria varians]
MSDWMQRHQVLLYLLAIAAGAVAGWFVPGVGPVAGPAVTPLLALLLYATFLGIPLRHLGRALRDWRFLATVLVLDFVLVPVVVLGLVHLFGIQGPLLTGALLVLLAPCVDYVIVFTGLAGGAAEKLLAAAPVLMLLQIPALPGFLWLFLGPDAAHSLPWGPFAEALLTLILVPLGLAVATQWATAHSRLPRAWEGFVAAAMVPLMVLVLATVVASQIAGVGARVSELAPLVPLYAVFALVMTAVGRGVGRLALGSARERRAVLFTGVTRNSLVVLPLALALPGETGLAPLAVVTQTLVELPVMVALVWAVPRLVPLRGERGPGDGAGKLQVSSEI